MSVVCGTDFSEYGARAVRVAACFARALGEPLVLAHVVDLGALGWASDSITSQWTEAATRKLGEVAKPLAAQGLRVDTRALAGTPDEELAELAGALPARLVVVGVLGRRSPERWRVGSLAARLAQEAPVPVLLVSEAEPFEACATGERPLRVLVGTDFSRSSDAAVSWLATLRRLGTCDVTLLHLYDSAQQAARLGLSHDEDEATAREVDAMLTRDLGARIGELGGPGRTVLRAMPTIGWIADSLALVAEQERFDLVLVGGRRRTGLARIRHDSVSNALLRIAPPAVLRVPVTAAEVRAQAIPRVASVLVPTDLSELGNAAVPYAYALAPPGGTVHLMHVIESSPVPNPLYAHYTPGHRPTAEQRAAQERDLEASLTALVPAEAEPRGIETRIELVSADDVAEAIRAAAERLGVDAICMGTAGRSGLSELLAGSVARDVAAKSRRPIFLVRPPRD